MAKFFEFERGTARVCYALEERASISSWHTGWISSNYMLSVRIRKDISSMMWHKTWFAIHNLKSSCPCFLNFFHKTYHTWNIMGCKCLKVMHIQLLVLKVGCLIELFVFYNLGCETLKWITSPLRESTFQMILSDERNTAFLFLKLIKQCC